MLNWLIDQTRGRKFLAWLVTMLCVTIALCVGSLTADQWVENVKWLTTALLAANAVEDSAKALGSKEQTPTVAAPVTTTPETPNA